MRFPLVQPIESRKDNSQNTDSKMGNCVVETRRGKKDFKKRPGLSNLFTNSQVTSLPTGQAHGMYRGAQYLWVDTGSAANGGTLYSYDSTGNQLNWGQVGGAAGMYLTSFTELGSITQGSSNWGTAGLQNYVVPLNITTLTVTIAGGGGAAGGAVDYYGPFPSHYIIGAGGGAAPVISFTFPVTASGSYLNNGDTLQFSIGAGGVPAVGSGDPNSGNITYGGTGGTTTLTNLTTSHVLITSTGGSGGGSYGLDAGFGIHEGSPGAGGTSSYYNGSSYTAGPVGGHGNQGYIIMGTTSNGVGGGNSVSGGGFESAGNNGSGGGGYNILGTDYGFWYDGYAGGTGFAQIQYNGNSTSLLVHNGTQIWYTIGGALSQSFNTTTGYIDPNTLGPFCYGLCNIDGYGVLGTTSGFIYTSNLNDTTKWNASNYLAYDGDTGILVAIAKYLNYIVAFGGYSFEVLYDAGNVTGSPLNIARPYTSTIGCAAGGSVVEAPNTVFWVGQSKRDGRGVYMLNNLAPQKISTRWIDQYLENANLGDIRAHCFVYKGHTLYCLTLHAQNQTFVFDVEEQEWYEWTSTSSTNGVYPTTEGYWQPAFSASWNNGVWSLGDDTSILYSIEEDYYSDDGQQITVRCVTDQEDFGTSERKSFDRIELIGDKNQTTVYIQHTDNDYSSWSNLRSIFMGQPRAQIHACGKSRRRAWQLLHWDLNSPLRITDLEIDIEGEKK